MAATMNNQRPQRERSHTGFSITSDKSNNSRRSKTKEQLKETPLEKHKHTFSTSTKANPNAAINEMQPVAQQLEKATIGSLRGSTYFDVHGAQITDPDFSNPTRRRTERPLETIASFEAAIDREYRRQREAARHSVVQPDSNGSDHNGYESRRSSYFGGGDYAGNGYYNHPARARSAQLDNLPTRNRFAARMNSDPAFQRYNNNNNNNNHNGNNGYPYSTPGYGQTRESVKTGGSNGSDQWHNSTDPSSDNSSIERMKQEGHGEMGYPTPQRERISEDGHYTFGSNGYNPSYMGAGGHNNAGPSTPGSYLGHGQQQQQYNNYGPPPPAKGGPVMPPAARMPIKLDNSGPTGAGYSASRPSMADQPKRKSWLKRTFSKNKA